MTDSRYCKVCRFYINDKCSVAAHKYKGLACSVARAEYNMRNTNGKRKNIR